MYREMKKALAKSEREGKRDGERDGGAASLMKAEVLSSISQLPNAYARLLLNSGSASSVHGQRGAAWAALSSSTLQITLISGQA